MRTLSCVNSTSANHNRRLGFDFALRTNVRNLEYVDVSLSPLAICGAVFRRAHSHVCRDWSDVAPELVQKGSAVGSVKRYGVGWRASTRTPACTRGSRRNANTRLNAL